MLLKNRICMRHQCDYAKTKCVVATKALKKKDALLKPDFDSLPVGPETK